MIKYNKGEELYTYLFFLYCIVLKAKENIYFISHTELNPILKINNRIGQFYLI